MLSELRARLTYANVMATVAVFVALGGGSYAAITVTGGNVKNSSLTGKDVRKNSLTGADVTELTSDDVANGRLLAEDFAPGQLPQGERGPPGGSVGTTAYPHSGADGGILVSNDNLVGDITVPAGFYTYVATLDIDSPQTDVVRANCSIVVNGGQHNEQQAIIGANGRVPMALVTAGQGGTAEIRCSVVIVTDTAPVGLNAALNVVSHITATQVSAVTPAS